MQGRSAGVDGHGALHVDEGAHAVFEAGHLHVLGKLARKQDPPDLAGVLLVDKGPEWEIIYSSTHRLEARRVRT